MASYPELKEKIVAVTGAAQGIGFAIAHAFAEQGSRVAIIDLDEAGARGAAEKLGDRAIAVTADVSRSDQVRAAFARIRTALGPTDVLVNNAGVGHVGTILTTNPEDLERLWQVNVRGAYFLSRAVLPAMIARSHGSIINLGSVAALIGMESRFAYTVSKHALMGMTRAMAMDHGLSGVRINCICPGRTQTPFVDQRMREYSDPKVFMSQMVAPHALKRLAQPWEIAAAALYLASDASANVTGSALSVDGGYTAGK